MADPLACPACGNDKQLRFAPNPFDPDLIAPSTYGRCMDCGHLWDLPTESKWVN